MYLEELDVSEGALEGCEHGKGWHCALFTLWSCFGF